MYIGFKSLGIRNLNVWVPQVKSVVWLLLSLSTQYTAFPSPFQIS